MSKIVCDICGATYPETEELCPICGTAKSNAPAAGDTAQDDGYAYVKGGRFSKSNVKKRNNGNQELPRTVMPAPQPEPSVEAQPAQKQDSEPAAPAPVRERKPERSREPRRNESSVNIGLILIVILLVAAIVAVCVYIGITWVRRINTESTQPTTTAPIITDATGGVIVDPGPVSIPCTGLSLPFPEYVFTAAGQILQLDPRVIPADTTEQVGYIAADPRIAIVDANGLVTAVADGETVIYVTCGSYKTEIKIICNVGVAVETTQPTQPEETEPTEPFVILVLNRSDFTLNGYGDKWNLLNKNSEIAASDITWTSSNESVATVDNGLVVAVGNGKATITAEYKGQVVTCVVYCNNVVKASFTLSHTSVTIKVGESFTLQARDGEGLRIDPSELKFYTEKEGFISVDENGRITGLQNNMSYKEAYKVVYVEYNGEVLKCIVYVKDAG